MMTGVFEFFKRKFINNSEKKLKNFELIVKEINKLEEKYQSLPDEDLKNQTEVFKGRLLKGENLDQILPEAFAVVREASLRVLGLRHYDVQLIGGIALHQGMIAEMRTGEGKTLVATLPAYLNSLAGEGVHVVTVNDYLVLRDANWVGKIYEFLGLSVGCITSNIEDDQTRKQAYNCDITFITNNELGFDHLRDNRRYDIDQLVQRKLNYAIIDEVDSILIDEARTPLIISGPSEDSANLYKIVNSLINLLMESDFEIDYKARNVTLTEDGSVNVENILRNAQIISQDSGLYDIENSSLVHYLTQALRAHKIYRKDVDYLVKDDQVMIIDEFTGRVLSGRRYSEGLHQAIEAKEDVEIQKESKTLASITFQNYFRLYSKLSGMTGTASTEETEFRDIYNLEVLYIPTNKTIKVAHSDDEVYATSEEKMQAILEEVKKCHAIGQPVLIGTASIEKSEQLALLLKTNGIEHRVLNAKLHQQEAYIIAQAGKSGSITIATNMAGRGTDILLGGNPSMFLDQELKKREFTQQEIAEKKERIFAEAEEDKKKVLSLGGLYVLGTERHESRRIDNQLRGRAGRQGDPGKTKFYLSLEDDLMKIFINKTQKISTILTSLGLKKGEAIHHSLITKSIERAQAKVEAHNYDTRKFVLQYDNVVNEQRKIIYEQRKEILAGDQELIEDISENMIKSLIEESAENITFDAMEEDAEENIQNLHNKIVRLFGLDLPLKQWIEQTNADNLKDDDRRTAFEGRILEAVSAGFGEKKLKYADTDLNAAKKQIFLLSLDSLWEEHLQILEELRKVIGYRAYGQKNPLIEYRNESFKHFQKLIKGLKELYVLRIFKMQFNDNPETNNQNINKNSDSEQLNLTGRNQLCSCNSGKKYKHCHGKLIKVF